MKILLVRPGKLNTVPMGVFVLKSLRKLGHEVIDFDLSSNSLDKLSDRLRFGSKEFHGRLNRRFRMAVEIAKPDIMLTIFGFDLSEESLEYLKFRRIPRVCWWLNDPFQFQRSLKKAGHYDFLFSNAYGSIDAYKQAGVNHAYWLPTACDPEVHRKLEPIDEYRCEICFAGDWSLLREEWCNLLAKNFDIKIFGPWKKKLQSRSPLLNHVVDGFFTPEQMARMFASADVVFNLHSWYGNWDHGTNPRLFEAAGCGACQVVDWKRDIPELFDCGGEVVTYTDMADLVGKVRELLQDENRREQMGRNAQARAYADHTYAARMKTLLVAVGAS